MPGQMCNERLPSLQANTQIPCPSRVEPLQGLPQEWSKAPLTCHGGCPPPAATKPCVHTSLLSAPVIGSSPCVRGGLLLLRPSNIFEGSQCTWRMTAGEILNTQNNKGALRPIAVTGFQERITESLAQQQLAPSCHGRSAGAESSGVASTLPMLRLGRTGDG